MNKATWLLLGSGFTLGSCFIFGSCGGSVSLTDRPCPCSSGWTCCESSKVCVAAGTTCEPTSNAGPQSSTGNAGTQAGVDGSPAVGVDAAVDSTSGGSSGGALSGGVMSEGGPNEGGVGATPGARGCTGSGGSGSSSSSGGNGGLSSGSSSGSDGNIDLCRGDIGCGVGLYCSAPQGCCVAGVATASADPSTCACGAETVVVGTHCAASCPSATQVCYQDPGGKNTDCPSGQQCLIVEEFQVGAVGTGVAKCAPGGSAAGSASSSGGGSGTGSCVMPGKACSGALFECSSALSCAPGQICCETTATVCTRSCLGTGSSSSSGGANASGSSSSGA